MTTPRTTPNPATSTRPTRSSERVAHKKPLGWLPWLLLLLLLLLLALVAYGVSEANEKSSLASQPKPTASTTPDASGNTSASGNNGAVSGAGAGPAAAVTAAAAGALVGGAGVHPTAADVAASAGAGGKRSPGTAGTVLFAEGSAAIDRNGKTVIDTAAANLKRAGATKAEVIGYTDVVAGAPVNGPLSKQRADAVAAVLRAELPAVAVTTSAKGQDEPIASNSTAQGRQQNRRAAIVAQG